MSSTSVNDPGIWCHAELDESGLSEGAGWLLSDPDYLSFDAPLTLHPDDRGRGRTVARSRFSDALEVMEASLDGCGLTVPTGQLGDSLLELWDLADDLGPQASEPLERLLAQTLRHRRLSTDQVRAALAELRHRLGDGPTPDYSD